MVTVVPGATAARTLRRNVIVVWCYVIQNMVALTRQYTTVYTDMASKVNDN